MNGYLKIETEIWLKLKVKLEWKMKMNMKNEIEKWKMKNEKWKMKNEKWKCEINYYELKWKLSLLENEYYYKTYE